MLDEQETIIDSSAGSNNLNDNFGNSSGKKKILIVLGVSLALVIIGVVVFLIIKNSSSNQTPKIAKPVATTSVSTGTPGTLPSLSLDASSTVATSSFSNMAVEYLAFSDFYKAPDNKTEIKFSDYELPLNVKIDVANYYDLSRKLNLDPALDNLSNNGFATIANPWEKDAPDFYSVYSNLEKNQIPVLITSDFMLYYYQTIAKNVYKDIEESIFYDNLWSINKNLYEAAKNRYETRLASIGEVNDSILEGERLEAAFFAVSLELLKPAVTQITKDNVNDPNKFNAHDADTYYFVTPPYLSDDVLKEVKLIREGQQKIKSPVMLYSRDYKDFIVPVDYKNNARLNNFYLTTKWLNSVFPLNYQDKTCPNCLIDKADWRLGMIAASFISNDFSALPELKNKWARIYKVMSYFNPLRDDLNYVYYRDTLKSIFGENYNIEQLFDDSNKDAQNNLQKLQAKLNTLEFSPFLGAIDKTDPNTNYRLGFKMLVEAYSPNDYIFSHLSYPYVSTYQGASPKLGVNNISACQVNKINQRCNGFALDVVNLLSPVANNSYFSENTSYLNYEKETNNLKDKLNQSTVWHSTNYWSNLSALSAYLNIPKENQPLFSRSTAWRDQTLVTAASAWINMQLPVEKFSLNKSTDAQGFKNFSQYSENSYVEPNLNLINELLASNVMMQKMFTALQIDQEVTSVPNNLQNLNSDLTKLKGIVEEELAGQTLSADDNSFVNNFAKQFIIASSLPSQKQLTIKSANTTKNVLKEDLSHLKLMILAHEDGGNKIFSVGPVWSYIESR